MNLKDPLPETFPQEARTRLGDEDDIQIAVAADLSPHGAYGETWLVASAEQVVVAPVLDGEPSGEDDPSAGEGPLLFARGIRSFPTKDLKKVRTEAASAAL